jgi:hypothetical protein
MGKSKLSCSVLVAVITTEDKLLVSSAKASWLVKHITAKGIAAYFFNIKTLCKIKGTPNGQSPRVYEVALRGPETALE